MIHSNVNENQNCMHGGLHTCTYACICLFCKTAIDQIRSVFPMIMIPFVLSCIHLDYSWCQLPLLLQLLRSTSISISGSVTLWCAPIWKLGCCNNSQESGQYPNHLGFRTNLCSDSLKSLTCNPTKNTEVAAIDEWAILEPGHSGGNGSFLHSFSSLLS